jgi:hypothetical protein
VLLVFSAKNVQNGDDRGMAKAYSFFSKPGNRRPPPEAAKCY